MSISNANNSARPDFSRMRTDQVDPSKATDVQRTPSPAQPDGDAAVPDAERVQPTDAQSQGARQLQNGVGDQLRQQIERLLPGGGNGTTPEGWLEAGGRRRPPRGGGTVRAQAEPVVKPNPVA